MIDAPLLDFDHYHRDELPARAMNAVGRQAAADVRDLGALALVVGDGAITYQPGGAMIDLRSGDDGAQVAVELSRRAWSDLVQEVRSAAALIFAGEVRLRRGTSEQLRRWQPALRALYAGVPIFDPQAVDLCDRDGRRLDLHRSFSLDDDAADPTHFLGRAGFLHVRGVFAPEEMARLRAEVDALQAAARPGDDRSWWAKEASGRQVVCRLIYAGLTSAYIGGLADDARMRRLVALSGFTLQPAPDRQEGDSVVIKNPGIVEGLSDLPWHQDCGLGGHPYTCPAVAIGVQLEDATPASGQLHFIAGTQGSSCHPFTAADLPRLPHVALETAAGDCTVHVTDVVHAAPPPQARGRRTLYLPYFPPRMFDAIGAGEAYNDIVRRRRHDGHVPHTDEILAGRA